MWSGFSPRLSWLSCGGVPPLGALNPIQLSVTSQGIFLQGGGWWVQNLLGKILRFFCFVCVWGGGDSLDFGGWLGMGGVVHFEPFLRAFKVLMN